MANNSEVTMHDMAHNNNIGEASTDNKSEGMSTIIEIKVKTMDSQTHHLHIHNQMTVHDLKEGIAVLNGMSIEQQRLIYRGKVLQDDQLLSAHNVSTGDTLHLVHNQLATPSSGSLPNCLGMATNFEGTMLEVHRSGSNSSMSSLESTPVLEQLAGVLPSTRVVINATAQLLCNSPLQREENDHGAGFQSRQVHTPARRGENSSTQQALSDTISLPPCHHPPDGRTSGITVIVENWTFEIEHEPSHQNEEGSAGVLQQNTEGALQEGIRDHGRHDHPSTNATNEHGEQSPNPISRRLRFRCVIVRQIYQPSRSVIQEQEVATPIGTTDTVNENRGVHISSGPSTAELASDPESSDESEDANAGTCGSNHTYRC